MPAGTGPSLLLIQEHFSNQDPRFLETLRAAADPEILVSFADRWKNDARPWARARVLEYLDQGCESPGHQPVIKRLFKHAEQHHDSELMAGFMCAFDRMVRRRRRRRYHYDPATRRVWEEEKLVAPGTLAVVLHPQTFRPVPPGVAVFSNRTRNYLRRRVWRYFRRMAHQHPHEYAATIAAALQRYRDEDLGSGESILDCWSLMHACFSGHEVVRFNANHANVKVGRSLAQLSAAPYQPKLWAAPAAASILLGLLAQARSRLVRVWAMQLLRRHHGEHLAGISPQHILVLLEHEDADVQQFAAEILEKLRGIEDLPLETWLAMLKTKNLTALEAICQLLRRHAIAERFSLGQLVDLATAAPTPLARLGLDLLRSRPILSPEDRSTITALADARCGSIGRELARWALGIVAAPSVYQTETVAAFFDSLNLAVRLGAWEWLTPESAGYNDPALFARLIETPCEHLRLRIIEMLEKRSKLPGLGAENLSSIWCAVLLGIHRGGRHKLKALRQISEAVRENPEDARTLIPVLAIAIRSVRSTEARCGLAALVKVVQCAPQLADVSRRFLPELDLSPSGATT